MFFKWVNSSASILVRNFDNATYMAKTTYQDAIKLLIIMLVNHNYISYLFKYFLLIFIFCICLCLTESVKKNKDLLTFIFVCH